MKHGSKVLDFHSRDRSVDGELLILFHLGMLPPPIKHCNKCIVLQFIIKIKRFSFGNKVILISKNLHFSAVKKRFWKYHLHFLKYLGNARNHLSSAEHLAAQVHDDT